MPRSRVAAYVAAPALVVSALVTITTLTVVTAPSAEAATYLSRDNLTMVSTRADGTAGPALPSTFGADEVAISDDGKVIAFTSPIPAPQLVTDPAQTGQVTDNNNGAAAESDREDVFVWDSRLPAPAGPIVSLVSRNAAHTGTGDAASSHPVIAPLGLGVAFESAATDLTTNQIGAFSRHLYLFAPVISDIAPVFMVDQALNGKGSSSLASDPSVAVQTFPPSVKVAFTSHASDLVDPLAHSSSGADQVYVRSYGLSSGVEMISVNKNDGNGTKSGAGEPEISADGSTVVFASGGDGLMGPVNTGGTGGDIFIRKGSATTLMSGTSATVGTGGNNSPVISADGKSVAWDGNSTSLPGVTHSNSNAHVYFRKVGGSIQAVDTDSSGTNDCEGASNWPGISADGTLVAFESTCNDITGATGNQVYARRMLIDPSVPAVPDLAHAQLISINDNGTGGGDSDASLCSHNDPPHCGAGTDPSAAINADGTAIAFTSGSSNIAAPPGGQPPFNAGDVFVRYPNAVPSGKTVDVTTSAAGKHASNTSRSAVISKDGGTVAFVSLADDLVTPDGNGATDVFAADLKDTYVIDPVNPVNESDGSVTITVSRTGRLATADSVEVATGDGFDTSIAPNPFPGTIQATEPGDYSSVDKTLLFPPGVATATFQVPIADDNAPEQPEAFHVSLSAHSGAVNVPGPGPLSYAYVEILDDDGVTQDWHAANTSTPGTAHVGDQVTIKTQITVDAGADDLHVASLAPGAGTTGLSDVQYDTPAPFDVAAGTTKEVTATATVTAAPGTLGVELQTAVTGELGAATAIRTSDSTAIPVTEAVTGVLTGAPATALLTDQFTYTLTLTNDSDTTAEVTTPALTAPAGATQTAAPTACGTNLAAGASTSCAITVDVDDADADLATITEAPTATYAMSAISLPDRPVLIAPVVTTAHAPVLSYTQHNLVDTNGGTLVSGDPVTGTVKVTNTGHGDTTGSIEDSLSNLDSVTNIQLDGGACGTCSYDNVSQDVLAPGVALAAGATVTLTYNAQVVASPVGPSVASVVTTSFSPATTGTSPTPVNLKSLTIGAANQDWGVSITQQPPATAQVGDTVTVKATVSVDPGANDLAVGSVSLVPGSGTGNGVATPGSFNVPAGSSAQTTVTARVIAAPGAGGVLVPISVHGTLGATTTDKPASSNAITVEDAVSATLTGGPAIVTTADQITYKLTFTNGSDVSADILPHSSTLTAPAGTTAAGAMTCSPDVPANGTGSCTLTVNVDDADVDGQVLTETAGPVEYNQISIPGDRAISIAPPSVSSTIGTPDTTKPDVTIDKAAGQDDPQIGGPTVHYTAQFSEDVTGFDSSDLLLGTSTVGGPLQTVVTGGPQTYDVAVSGMSQTGDVKATVAANGVQDLSGNLNNGSTSSDNSIHYVKTIASHTAVSTTPGSTVYGQPVTATATVTFDSGTSTGAVQFTVDGVDQGASVPLAGGLATSAPLTGPGSVPLEPGAHAIGATFTPTALPYTPSSGSQSLPVSKGTTTTSVVVGATTVTATVKVVAPAAGAPSGSVAFQVSGAAVGSAPVGPGGVATLTYTVPSGAAQNVGAAYAGDTHFTASSGSTSRNDPSITAKVTSAQGRSKFGWYRTPVKITFTCTTNGSPLAAPCPDPVTIGKNGAGQSVSKTITAQDGGMDTVTVNGIDIDQTAPTVSVGGVTKGGRYPTPGPKPTCVGKDALSGIASCSVHMHRSGGALSTTVGYTLRAVDKAGNVTTKKGKYTLSGVGFKGAPFKSGAYTLHLGQTYLLVVHSVAEPTYLDAAPFPHRPFKVDPFPFRSAGHHLWSIPILAEPALAVHTYWNVGVKLPGRLIVIKIRVLP